MSPADPGSLRRRAAHLRFMTGPSEYPSERCTHPNCGLHGKSPCDDVRCDGTIAPTGQWAELLSAWGERRVEEFEMIERGRVRVGDIVYSSHFGEQVVTSAETYGADPGTTELRFGTWTDHTGEERIKNERYDADSLIPRRITAAFPDQVDFLVQWQCPDEDSHLPGFWEDTVARPTLSEAEEVAETMSEVRATRIVRRVITGEIVMTLAVRA